MVTNSRIVVARQPTSEQWILLKTEVLGSVHKRGSTEDAVVVSDRGVAIEITKGGC
jgi:hypothetical protein